MISTEESLKYIDLIKRLIGARVCSLSNSQYYFNGVKDEDELGDLEIIANSGLKVCFTTLSDGESVGVYEGELEVPEPFEVVDGEYASWQKMVLKQATEIIDTKIIGIDAMYDFYSKLDLKILAGWRVNLSTGDYFVFYNCGDSAHFLFNELPDGDKSGISTTWKSI